MIHDFFAFTQFLMISENESEQKIQMQIKSAAAAPLEQQERRAASCPLL